MHSVTTILSSHLFITGFKFGPESKHTVRTGEGGGRATKN